MMKRNQLTGVFDLQYAISGKFPDQDLQSTAQRESRMYRICGEAW